MEFKDVDFESVEFESLDKDTLKSLATSADRDIEDKIGEYYAKRAESIRSKKLEKEAEAIPNEGAFVPKRVVLAEEPKDYDFRALSRWDYSLFLFSPKSKFRIFCKDITSSFWFTLFILLNILANCVVLALIDPTGTTSQTWVRSADIYFAILYTTELLLRLVAKGGWWNSTNPGVAYVYGAALFRDWWSILDLIVVISAWPPLFLSDGDGAAFRGLKVLRPLRILVVVPFMKNAVGKLLLSIPLLLDVTLQLFFILALFSIMGLILFNGTYHQNCTNGSEPYTDENNPDPILCGFVVCTSVVPDASPPLQCSTEGSTGIIFPSPGENFLNFDNFWNSLLLTFSSSTLEGWTDAMYIAMDTNNPAALLYFVLLVVLVGFLIINLALAVIAETFQRLNVDNADYQMMHLHNDERELDSYTLKDRVEIFLREAHITVGRYMGWYVPVQKLCRRIGLNPIFELFITIVVIVNVVILLAVHYPFTETARSVFSGFTFAFTIIYVIEMFMKLSAMGPFEYFGEPFNVIDSVVTIGSLIQIFLGSASVGAFRVLRLLRIVRLVKVLRSLHLVVLKAVASFVAVLRFLPVLVLFLFVFTILGAQFFGRVYVTTESTPDFPDVGSICTADAKSDTGCPRANFSTFWNAFLVVFQVQTGEDWQTLMYESMGYTGWYTAIFYVVLFWTTNFVLLNIFLTIMLIRFSEPDDEYEASSVRDTSGRMTTKEAFANLWMGIKKCVNKNQQAKSVISDTEDPGLDFAEDLSFQTARSSFLDAVEDGHSGDTESVEYGPEEAEGGKERENKSLYLFGEENKFRLVCQTIVENRVFKFSMIAVIVGSVISLMLYSPQWPEGSGVVAGVRVANIVWTVIFTIEALLKTVAHGFVMHPGSYLRDGWNVLDFIIVVTSWLSLIPTSNVLVQSFRAVQTLRPLRLVRKLPGLFVVFSSVVKALPVCGNVVLIALLNFILFAAVGVSFFAGSFYACQCDFVPYGTDTPVIGSTSSHPLSVDYANRQSFGSTCSNEFIEYLQTLDDARTVCEENGGTWVSYPSNFDNSLNAMLTLFEVSTLENWVDIMYAAMDAVGIDREPVEDYNEAASLFFIAFILAGAFFILNMFVSVIADAFSTIKREKEYGGSVLLTRKQFEWLEGQRMVLRMRVSKQYIPPRPMKFLSGFRFFCYKLSTSAVFEGLIVLCIILNALFMALEYWMMPPSWVSFHLIAGAFFTAVFLAETFIKIVGLGFKQYFGSLWNIFDFLISVISVVPLIIEIVVLSNPDLEVVNSNWIRMLRILRLLRLLRLAKSFQKINMLFQTLYISLPAIYNVGTLLLLVFFVYGVFGVFLFGTVGILEYPPPNGGGIGPYSNFWNFGWALLTLLRCATGEAWNSIMWDLIVQGGGYTWSWLYFITFITIGSFIVLNLFIAIVLEAFATVMEQDKFEVRANDFMEFQKAWAIFDPNGDKYIDVGRDLKPFLREVAPPLGPGRLASVTEILQLIDQLRLPDGTSLKLMKSGKVGFHELLSALVNHAYRVDLETLPSGLQAEVRYTSKKFNNRAKPLDQEEEREEDQSEQEARLYFASTTLQVIARQYMESHGVSVDTGDDLSISSSHAPVANRRSIVFDDRTSSSLDEVSPT
ncbi:hypothetical protein NDN08_007577 [Rhodosorus marinus]|uniref:Ion transport domain-containing protein n=1 Tax=Rhodosorus marinus TaxID=101924 RepID=A0AAV8V3L4_9RHOD|nr:hypothetical protein NDN08_007577 [Rhodosorus marinus]